MRGLRRAPPRRSSKRRTLATDRLIRIVRTADVTSNVRTADDVSESRTDPACVVRRPGVERRAPRQGCGRRVLRQASRSCRVRWVRRSARAASAAPTGALVGAVVAAPVERQRADVGRCARTGRRSNLRGRWDGAGGAVARGPSWRVSGVSSARTERGERASVRAAGRRRDRIVRRQPGRANQVPAPLFFVGLGLAAGDFGLSRLRYDSPSITRS